MSAWRSLALALALALAGAWGVRWAGGRLAAAAPPGRHALVAVTVPSEARAGVRYTYLTGAQAPPGELRLLLRVCRSDDPGDCPIRRTRRLDGTGDVQWTGFGRHALPAGRYDAELLLSTPRPWSAYRAEDSYAWTLHVE